MEIYYKHRCLNHDSWYSRTILLHDIHQQLQISCKTDFGTFPSELTPKFPEVTDWHNFSSDCIISNSERADGRSTIEMAALQAKSKIVYIENANILSMHLSTLGGLAGDLNIDTSMMLRFQIFQDKRMHDIHHRLKVTYKNRFQHLSVIWLRAYIVIPSRYKSE